LLNQSVHPAIGGFNDSQLSPCDVFKGESKIIHGIA
jgi:hypothetical protein